MCTYILYHDPISSQPFIMASTRDEHPDRSTTPPFHWNDASVLQPYASQGRLKLHYSRKSDFSAYVDAGIVAAQDKKLGGSFAGYNRHGLMVAMNNRETMIKANHPRGGLVLDALTFAQLKRPSEHFIKSLSRSRQKAD